MDIFILRETIVIFDFVFNGITYKVDIRKYFNVLLYLFMFTFGLHIGLNWEKFLEVNQKSKLYKFILLIGLVLYPILPFSGGYMGILLYSVGWISFLVSCQLFLKETNWEMVGIKNRYEHFGINIESYEVEGKRIRGKFKKIFLVTGKNSMAIFLMHQTILILFIHFTEIGNPGILPYRFESLVIRSLLPCFIIYLICLILAIMIKKIPKNKFLIGK